MNIKELWTGTKEEQRARADVIRLVQKQTRMDLTPKEEEILYTQRRVSRGWFLRQGIAGGLGIIVVASTPVVYVLWQEVNREEADIDTYKRYRDGLISIGKGDEEVGELLKLVAERARLGRREGLALIKPRGFDEKRNLLVAVISPTRNTGDFVGAFKVADTYVSNKTIALEVLKVPITSIWAGALLAHELLRARSYLEPGWDWFDIKRRSFELEFRLLNKVTNGKFNETVLQIAKEQEGWILELDKNQIKSIDSVFEPSRSQIEAKQRELDYLFAVNFAIAAERASVSGQDANLLKIDYLKTRFDPESKLPFMAKPLARE